MMNGRSASPKKKARARIKLKIGGRTPIPGSPIKPRQETPLKGDNSGPTASVASKRSSRSKEKILTKEQSANSLQTDSTSWLPGTLSGQRQGRKSKRRRSQDLKHNDDESDDNNVQYGTSNENADANNDVESGSELLTNYHPKSKRKNAVNDENLQINQQDCSFPDRPIQKLRLNLGRTKGEVSSSKDKHLAIVSEPKAEEHASEQDTTKSSRNAPAETFLSTHQATEREEKLGVEKTINAGKAEVVKVAKKRGRKKRLILPSTNVEGGKAASCILATNQNSGLNRTAINNSPFSSHPISALTMLPKRRPGRPPKKAQFSMFPSHSTLNTIVALNNQRVPVNPPATFQNSNYPSTTAYLASSIETEEERRARGIIKDFFEKQVGQMERSEWNRPFTSLRDALHRLWPFYGLLGVTDLSSMTTFRLAGQSNNLEGLGLDEEKKDFTKDLKPVSSELIVLEQRLCLEEEKFLHLKLKNEYYSKFASPSITKQSAGGSTGNSSTPIGPKSVGPATPHQSTPSLGSTSTTGSLVGTQHRPKLLPKATIPTNAAMAADPMLTPLGHSMPTAAAFSLSPSVDGS